MFVKAHARTLLRRRLKQVIYSVGWCVCLSVSACVSLREHAHPTVPTRKVSKGRSHAFERRRETEEDAAGTAAHRHRRQIRGMLCGAPWSRAWRADFGFVASFRRVRALLLVLWGRSCIPILLSLGLRRFFLSAAFAFAVNTGAGV